jgi:hypothetical protein
MDLRGIGWRGMDLIDLAEVGNQWKTLVKTVTNHRIAYNAGEILNIYITDSF